MARRRLPEKDGSVVEESSWRYTAFFLVLLLLFSAGFLYYFFGPGINRLRGTAPNPSIFEKRWNVDIGGTVFRIPERYMIFPRDRRDAQTDTLQLYAHLPDMRGYSLVRREDFMRNDGPNDRLDILLSAPFYKLSEAQRLERIFAPLIETATPQPAVGGLMRYSLIGRENDRLRSIYAGHELFVGRDSDDAVALIICAPVRSEKIRHDCWRDLALQNLSVRLTFGRTHLADWQVLCHKGLALLNGFLAQPAPVETDSP